MSGDELREIPLSGVEQHSTDGSCWIVLHDKDATASFEDVGHSKDAREMAEEYLIGTFKSTSSSSGTKSDTGSSTRECSMSCALKNVKEIILPPTWSNFLIPTTIGIIIFVLYKGVVKGFA